MIAPGIETILLLPDSAAYSIRLARRRATGFEPQRARRPRPPAMDNERLQFLRDALAANADDTFARYALALEFARGGEPAQAWEHFRYLLDHHPDYSAAYYQAGTLLADQGRTGEARDIFRRGVEVTRRLGQNHARSELEAALDALD